MSVCLLAPGHVVFVIWQLLSWSEMSGSVHSLVFSKCVSVKVLFTTENVSKM